MGSNYYLQLVSKETKQAILRAVEAGDYELAKELIESIKTIHIGKLCGGCTFTFNHHNWDYFETVEEFTTWLKSGQIKYEDGTNMTFEEFWEMITNANVKGKTSSEDIEKFGLFWNKVTSFC